MSTSTPASVNVSPPGAPSSTTVAAIDEARRQIEICNACRYCEGYCSVFPAVTRRRAFTDANIVQLASLCHNCRGCYYACQFIPPHEFALNLPKSLAEVRQQTWQDYAAPRAVAREFQRSGAAVATLAFVGFAVLIWLINTLGGQADGEGFYALLSHSAMVALFVPAFLLPVAVIAVGVRRFWRAANAPPFVWADFVAGMRRAATMRDLSGGHGEGCNFEDEDRFSNSRRWAHQATMYGFLLCFAATSVATVMHYVFDMPAPYPLWSLPKLLGTVGGLMLSFGTAALIVLKLRADRALADTNVWGGEMGFVLLLFVVSTSGLALYALGETAWLRELLPLHLGAVLAFFVLMPYTKMVHGFYRLAALTADAAEQRQQ